MLGTARQAGRARSNMMTVLGKSWSTLHYILYTHGSAHTTTLPAASSDSPLVRLARDSVTCSARVWAIPSSALHLLLVALAAEASARLRLAHLASSWRNSRSNPGPRRPQDSRAAGVTATPPTPGPYRSAFFFSASRATLPGVRLPARYLDAHAWWCVTSTHQSAGPGPGVQMCKSRRASTASGLPGSPCSNSGTTSSAETSHPASCAILVTARAIAPCTL